MEKEAFPFWNLKNQPCLSEEKAKTCRKTLPARREREKKLSNATPNLHTKKMAESQMFGPSYNHGCMKDAEQKQGKSVYWFCIWSCQNLQCVVDKKLEASAKVQADP